MSDGSGPQDRFGRLEAAAARAARPARWLARALTVAALVAAVAGAALWFFGFRDDGTGEAVVAALVLLVPAAWLLNARFALLGLADLPGTLGGLARRRAGGLREPAPPPADGPARAARAVYRVVRDYGELAAGRALVAQLASPHFWIFTVLAVAAVPLLALLAAGAALADLLG